MRKHQRNFMQRLIERKAYCVSLLDGEEAVG